jgi:membrane protease YdiL (CAAX protease family)
MTTPTVTAPEAQSTERRRIAAVWHTVLLLAALFGMSFLTAQSNHQVAAQHKLMNYSATIVLEWILFLYVWWGVRRAGMTMRELIGGSWHTVEEALLDIALGAGTLLLIYICLGTIAVATHAARTNTIENARKTLGFIAPHTGLEVAMFIALAVTAGFCEEVIARGYLQRQFAYWTHTAALGIVLQALCFGLFHGYEGWQGMSRIFVLAIILGVVAYARKSLRPGMMAHAALDVISGLLLRAITK